MEGCRTDCVIARQASLLLIASLIAVSPSDLTGQTMGYSAVLGSGYTSWSGPFVQDGAWGLPLVAVAAEWRPAGVSAVRAELGGGGRRADLGSTGFFSEGTTLTHYRAQIGLLGRLYAPRESRSTDFFGELGMAAWVMSACDVDLVGGPGFLGGETLDCDDWEPDDPGTSGRLAPEPSGFSVQIGFGVRRGPWSMALRYEPSGTLLETGMGPMKSKSFFLAFEWVFAGGGPKETAPSSRYGAPTPMGKAPRR